jgi:putative membrane protein
MAQEAEPEQLRLMQRMVELAEKQTVLSEGRTEASEFRSFLNAERTLSVWLRTALALMIAGLAIDRFSLLFDRGAGAATGIASPQGGALETASTWTCIALVALGVVMALATGIRFTVYARSWLGHHRLPPHHGPFLAPFFAIAVAVFGIVLLAITVIAAI